MKLALCILVADWTNVCQAVCAIGSLGVAVIGFAALFYQLVQLRRSVQSDTHGKLYTEDYSVVQLFLSECALRPFFYSNKPISEDDPNYSKAAIVAELLCSHFEHIILQEPNLPEHIRPRWDAYVRAMYAQSPIIRDHLRDNKDWYSEQLHELVKSPDGEAKPVC